MSDSVRNHRRRSASATLAAMLVAFFVLAAAPATADDGDGQTPNPVVTVDPGPVDPGPADPDPVDPDPDPVVTVDPPVSTVPDTPATSSGKTTTSSPQHTTQAKPHPSTTSTKHHHHHALGQTQGDEDAQPASLVAYTEVSAPVASPSAVTAESQHRTVLQRLTTPAVVPPAEASQAPEAPEAPEAAEVPSTRLVSSPTSTSGALPLWVPALILGLFLIVTGTTLSYRWRAGEVLWRSLPDRLRDL